MIIEYFSLTEQNFMPKFKTGCQCDYHLFLEIWRGEFSPNDENAPLSEHRQIGINIASVSLIIFLNF
jgi:hypothetical protein